MHQVQHRSRREIDPSGAEDYQCDDNAGITTDPTTSAQSCTICPMGSYVSKTFDDASFEVTQEACVLCPYDTFTDKTGQPSCTACIGDEVLGTLMEGSTSSDDCTGEFVLQIQH